MSNKEEIDSIKKEIKQLEEIIEKRQKRLEELNTEQNETIIPLPSTSSRSSSNARLGAMEELPKE